MVFTKFLILFIFLMSSFTWASTELASADDELFKEAGIFLSEGKLEASLKELNKLEAGLKNEKASKTLLAKLYYWKGIVANRMSEFPLAIKNFDLALKTGFDSIDVHYELGQALFANEQLKRARAKFARSYKIGHKKAVSLYYIAFISLELKDFKKAYKYFRLIEKLPASESKEVLQASRMQIADLFLSKAEEHPDSFRMIENHVIPQYERALGVNENSQLGRTIRSKIQSIQQKYDLLLFQLRNGRPVLRPPYFLKISQEVGYDSNVIYNPNETTVDRSKQSSEFTRTDIFGRYTFYHRDYFTFSPELRFNNTYYFNREPEIHRNDNRIYATALRNAYEYDLWGRPAALLFDLEYNEIHRDIRRKKKLQYNSSSVTYMIGHRMDFWNRGDTVFRLRFRRYDTYNDFSDSKSISFSMEQVVAFQTNTLLLYGSLDRSRVDFDVFDTNAFTLRADYIISAWREHIIPIVGVGVTRIDPVNDRSIRGIETLVTPSVRLLKNFGRNWRAILKYDKQDYDSQDNLLFAYQKETYGLELEYLF